MLRLPRCLLLILGMGLGVGGCFGPAPVVPPSAGNAPLAARIAALVAREADPQARRALIESLATAGGTLAAAVVGAASPSSSDVPEFEGMRLEAARRLGGLGMRTDAIAIYQAAFGVRSGEDAAVLAPALLEWLRGTGQLQTSFLVADAAAAGSPADDGLRLSRLRAMLELGMYERVLTVGAADLKEFDSPELRLIMAWAAVHEGRPARATEILEPLGKDPPSPWVEVVRGRAALARGEAAKAETLLQRAAGALPNAPEAVGDYALALAAAGKWGEALPVARQATQMRPERAGPWDVLAQAFLKTGDAVRSDWARGCAALAREEIDEAIRLIEKARAARPDPDFSLDLARAYIGAERLDDGLRVMEKVAEGSRDRLRLTYFLALGSGRLDVAARVAVGLQSGSPPEVGEGHAFAGQVYFRQGRAADAAAAYEKALAAQPGQPAYRLELARAQLAVATGAARAQAGSALRESLGAAGAAASPGAHHDIALLEMEAGRPAEALAPLSREASLLQGKGLESPLSTLATIFARLGLKREAEWCEQRSRRAQNAGSLLRRARNAIVRDRSPDAYRALARAAGESGDVNLARGAAMRLTQLAPGDPSAWLLLAGFCQQMGLGDERATAANRYQALLRKSGSRAQPGP